MDQAVFEEFYPKIYNYVYYRVLHRENAEDITGVVFYKALSNASLFDENKASYATWLFTIARNCVANFYRDQKDHKPFDELSCEIAAFGDIGEALLEGEDIQRLHMLLSTLSERERTVLALRFWGELSYREIARQTGLSEKNVGVILSRTITRLRREW